MSRISFIGRAAEELDAFLGAESDPAGSPEQTVDRLIHRAGLLSAALHLLPVPLSDLVTQTPIQLVMVVGIGRRMGFPEEQLQPRVLVRELAAVLGWRFVGRQGLLALMKVGLPVGGAILSLPMVYGWTVALGKLTERYFRARGEGRVHDSALRDELKSVFQSAMEKAKQDAEAEGFSRAARNAAEALKHASWPSHEGSTSAPVPPAASTSPEAQNPAQTSAGAVGLESTPNPSDPSPSASGPSDSGPSDSGQADPSQSAPSQAAPEVTPSLPVAESAVTSGASAADTALDQGPGPAGAGAVELPASADDAAQATPAAEPAASSSLDGESDQQVAEASGLELHPHGHGETTDQGPGAQEMPVLAAVEVQAEPLPSESAPQAGALATEVSAAPLAPPVEAVATVLASVDERVEQAASTVSPLPAASEPPARPMEASATSVDGQSLGSGAPSTGDAIPSQPVSEGVKPAQPVSLFALASGSPKSEGTHGSEGSAGRRSSHSGRAAKVASALIARDTTSGRELKEKEAPAKPAVPTPVIVRKAATLVAQPEPQPVPVEPPAKLAVELKGDDSRREAGIRFQPSAAAEALFRKIEAAPVNATRASLETLFPGLAGKAPVVVPDPPMAPKPAARAVVEMPRASIEPDVTGSVQAAPVAEPAPSVSLDRAAEPEDVKRSAPTEPALPPVVEAPAAVAEVPRSTPQTDAEVAQPEPAPVRVRSSATERLDEPEQLDMLRPDMLPSSPEDLIEAVQPLVGEVLPEPPSLGRGAPLDGRSRGPAETPSAEGAGQRPRRAFQTREFGGREDSSDRPARGFERRWDRRDEPRTRDVRFNEPRPGDGRRGEGAESGYGRGPARGPAWSEDTFEIGFGNGALGQPGPDDGGRGRPFDRDASRYSDFRRDGNRRDDTWRDDPRRDEPRRDDPRRDDPRRDDGRRGAGDRFREDRFRPRREGPGEMGPESPWSRNSVRPARGDEAVGPEFPELTAAVPVASPFEALSATGVKPAQSLEERRAALAAMQAARSPSPAPGAGAKGTAAEPTVSAVAPSGPVVRDATETLPEKTSEKTSEKSASVEAAADRVAARAVPQTQPPVTRESSDQATSVAAERVRDASSGDGMVSASEQSAMPTLTLLSPPPNAPRKRGRPARGSQPSLGATSSQPRPPKGAVEDAASRAATGAQTQEARSGRGRRGAGPKDASTAPALEVPSASVQPQPERGVASGAPVSDGPRRRGRPRKHPLVEAVTPSPAPASAPVREKVSVPSSPEEGSSSDSRQLSLPVGRRVRPPRPFPGGVPSSTMPVLDPATAQPAAPEEGKRRSPRKATVAEVTRPAPAHKEGATGSATSSGARAGRPRVSAPAGAPASGGQKSRKGKSGGTSDGTTGEGRGK